VWDALVPPLVAPNNPAILLCHGWGGLAAHLSLRYASQFARAGFICLCFDHRGWGNSDGVLIGQDADSVNVEARSRDAGTQEKVDGTARVQVVRNTVNMQWQMTDIDNAGKYLAIQVQVLTL
jgi:alpha-beta hydrolase superfamily lysophospholipase